MDCFLYPRLVLNPLFLGLLYKEKEPPGTSPPALLHWVLNLQYDDSSLWERYTQEPKKKLRELQKDCGKSENGKLQSEVRKWILCDCGVQW